MDSEPASHSADHLAVLVHGLWGNPKHLKYVASALREEHSADTLYILNAKRNAGSFTYDGIELGGERVAQEIEDKLEELEQLGQKITKISIVGYSLGGLVARYAIGLLYHKGWFDKLEPVNFTTFATPHLGARTPLLGYHNKIWNVVGARMLSASGRQLFGVDTFRDTGRPLLGVLADPSSVFIKGLKCFKNRSLYANIINDRTVTYYTASFSSTDPFVDLDKVDINYEPGYENVILDSEEPVAPKDPNKISSGIDIRDVLLRRIPLYAFLGVFIPIALTAFSATSVYQSIRSRQRIELHEAGKAGIAKGLYRIPLLLQDVRQMGEDMYEEAAATHTQEYLPDDEEQQGHNGVVEASQNSSLCSSESAIHEKPGVAVDRAHDSAFPTLALTDEQFAMVRSLDEVGFKKHRVHIHNATHSHAGIIVRMDVKRFEEGKIIVRHWLERFEI